MNHLEAENAALQTQAGLIEWALLLLNMRCWNRIERLSDDEAQSEGLLDALDGRSPRQRPVEWGTWWTQYAIGYERGRKLLPREQSDE